MTLACICNDFNARLISAARVRGVAIDKSGPMVTTDV
jgi:hypothetical protein